MHFLLGHYFRGKLSSPSYLLNIAVWTRGCCWLIHNRYRSARSTWICEGAGWNALCLVFRTSSTPTFSRIYRFDPWARKIPWRRKWQPTPVFLPGESHGWRSLEGYSPWDCKESDMTERISIQIFFSNIFTFIGKITLYTVQIIIFW